MEVLKYLNQEIIPYINIPANISVEFTNKTLIYTGSPMHTTIEVKSINNINDLICTKLKLKIRGTAVFTSTNSKEIEIITSNSQALVIPVTVTDVGGIEVSPQVLL